MLSSGILDVAVGLVFVYFILSIVCSSLNELLAQVSAARARYLRQGIENLFARAGKPEVKDLVLSHPLITSLSRPGIGPSYIPARNVALALFERIAGSSTLTFATVQSELRGDRCRTLFGEDLQRTLITLVESGGRLETAQKNIERWFDDAMVRVGGWYKRRAQQIIFGFALGIAIGGNVDTIAIARGLSTDPTARQNLAAMVADETDKRSRPGQEPEERLAAAIQETRKLGIPIGWSAPGAVPRSKLDLFEKICGLLFTGLAVSLGAPFWYDLLRKLLGLKDAAKGTSREPA